MSAGSAVVGFVGVVGLGGVSAAVVVVVATELASVGTAVEASVAEGAGEVRVLVCGGKLVRLAGLGSLQRVLGPGD